MRELCPSRWRAYMQLDTPAAKAQAFLQPEFWQQTQPAPPAANPTPMATDDHTAQQTPAAMPPAAQPMGAQQQAPAPSPAPDHHMSSHAATPQQRRQHRQQTQLARALRPRKSPRTVATRPTPLAARHTRAHTTAHSTPHGVTHTTPTRRITRATTRALEPDAWPSLLATTAHSLTPPAPMPLPCSPAQNSHHPTCSQAPVQVPQVPVCRAQRTSDDCRHRTQEGQAQRTLEASQPADTPPTQAPCAGGGPAALRSVAVYIIAVWRERGRITAARRETDGGDPMV